MRQLCGRVSPPGSDKGVDIVLGLARACPDIPFEMVRGWTLDARDEAALARGLEGLSNVTVLPPTNDMREVYARSRVVLAPSRWNEAFGRIAAEAHVNAIPVLASTRGGLPEAVGEGGRVVDPDGPISGWVTALRQLWDDPDAYARASDAARVHAARPAMTPDLQIDAFLDALHTCIRTSEA